MHVSDKEFTITKVLDAPRELVFQAWTEERHLAKWWGPKGISLSVAKLDVQPGGFFHYRMHSDDGHVTWGKFVYQEIVAPERIIFVNSFSDAEGNVVAPPFEDPWPAEIVNTVTFDEENGRTTLTLRAVPIRATEEEVRVFVAGFESMAQGYGGTFERLAEVLE